MIWQKLLTVDTNFLFVETYLYHSMKPQNIIFHVKLSVIFFCYTMSYSFSTGIAVHRNVKFQFCFVLVDCCYILMQAWLVCVRCRPFAGDGIEIGSLLVPMVLTSQMAFIERWESKYLKVTGNQRSRVAKENTKTNSFTSPACISDFWPLHLQCFLKSSLFFNW